MEQPSRQRVTEIDFYDKPPVRNVPIDTVHNYTPRVICEYREIKGRLPNPGYRRLFYHDHPDETPDQLRDELRALKEEISKYEETQLILTDEVRQYKDKQDNVERSVDVDRRFAKMVQGSSPLFAVQDVVIELLEFCDGWARMYIKKYNLQQRFEESAGKTEANRLPAAYRWFVEQSKNGDSDLQNYLNEVHSKVKVMSVKPIDAGSIFASLTSYKEAKEERDLRGHPCKISPQPEMENIIKFVEELAKGDGLLPKPYTNDDREFVMKAVEHWSKTHDQEPGPSGNTHQS